MESGAEREALIDEIVALETRRRDLEAKYGKRRARSVRFGTFGGKLLVYALLGRRLTLSLGSLILAIRENRKPFFGREMASTLDAAFRKLTGYKRWLVAFGALAALPGMISMVLLWQQNNALLVETENAVADAHHRERYNLLSVVYSCHNTSTDIASITTPVYSASSRAHAALRLIEFDSEELQNTEQVDPLGLNHFVDLGTAPLAGVDFSPRIAGERQRIFKVSFMGSSFIDASFSDCDLEQVWLDGAYLWNTNFRGATCREVSFLGCSIKGVDFRNTRFENCDFTGAIFDAKTLWPETFDPIAAGATKDLPAGPES